MKTTTGFRRVPTISIELVVQRRVKPCYGLAPEDHSAVIPRRTHKVTGLTEKTSVYCRCLEFFVFSLDFFLEDLNEQKSVI